MISTIDMQNMRHLNLFGKVTKVDTRFCFMYNEMLMFFVPKPLVLKAIGEGGKNAKKIHSIVGKKVKVLPIPSGIGQIKDFIQAIVAPVTFKGVEVKDGEVILTAGMQSKAALIGRNRRRLIEMQKIIKTFFDKEFKII